MNTLASPGAEATAFHSTAPSRAPNDLDRVLWHPWACLSRLAARQASGHNLARRVCREHPVEAWVALQANGRLTLTLTLT